MQVAVKIMKSSPIGRLNRGFGNTGTMLHETHVAGQEESGHVHIGRRNSSYPFLSKKVKMLNCIFNFCSPSRPYNLYHKSGRRTFCLL